MKEAHLPQTDFGKELIARHNDVLFIESPPRCGSTALARFFWHQPGFRYYAHEPYGPVYHDHKPVDVSEAYLASPIDLTEQYTGNPTYGSASGLIVKEMPFQVGEHFLRLLALATLPPIFLIRNPLLSIKSRMEKKALSGQETNFPAIETGWETLEKHIQITQGFDIDFVIVEANDMRNHPREFFLALTRRLNLPFSDDMLYWKPAGEINLDHLNGKEQFFYNRVLESTGIEPATEPIPDLTEFPKENNFREHVAQAQQIYQSLQLHPNRLQLPLAV